MLCNMTNMHNGVHGSSYDTCYKTKWLIIRKCILKGPYTPTFVTTPVVPATEDSPAVPEQTTVETVTNMTPENRAHYESEKEAIHLILTGIGDEIYSTVEHVQEQLKIMWKANESHETSNTSETSHRLLNYDELSKTSETALEAEKHISTTCTATERQHYITLLRLSPQLLSAHNSSEIKL
ncbi:hypothetical protein Tco_0020098 [Tanacetum coccineum]